MVNVSPEVYEVLDITGFSEMIAVEKAFQPGGDMIRRRGIRVESLARVGNMSVEGGVEFC